MLVDDISGSFSSEELNSTTSQKLVTYPSNIPTQRFLVLTKDSANPISYQLDEIVVLNTLEGSYVLNKGQVISGDEEVATITAEINTVEDIVDIVATPASREVDYEFKIIRQLFGSGIGIGTLSVGIASVTGVTTSVGVGTTATLFDAAAADLEGFTASVSIIRPSDQFGNYHEVIADRGNGDDVSLSLIHI